MKKEMFLVMLLVLAPIVFSQEIYNAENLILELSLNSEFNLLPKSDNYKIDYVVANVSFFPQDGFNQNVQSMVTTPTARSIGEGVIFRWDSPSVGQLSFNIKSQVMTNDDRVRVKSKVNFPIQNLPNGVLQYTEPSETIDSDNNDIIKLASELAAGEDDLYIVVNKVGVWTKKNVEYELSTLTAGVSQSASWVLRTRYGVCDEITNLFIGLLRSLGIPARFVSGVSYTELIEEGWGNHGWAEVYFPGYGWIPFDVTYGEYGFIDSSHVTLNKAIDAEESSTKYLWYGRDVDIKTKSLETDTKLIQSIGMTAPLIRLNAIAVKDSVGFGSYNLIEGIVENLDNSYYSTELHIAKPNEVGLRCCETKNVVLRPNERKKVYWTVSLPSNLRKTSVYTFPITIWSSKNITAQTSFKASLLNKVYSEQDIENILSQMETEESKVYSKGVELNCKINKEEFYMDDHAFVVCSMKNIGNVMLENIELCGGNDCEKFSLGISQESSKDFAISPSEVGSFEFVVKAESNDISKIDYVKYTVLDKPIISIENLNYPDNVAYGNQFSIGFSLGKGSLSTPKDVSVELYVGNTPKGWRMDKLNTEQAFSIDLDSSTLGLNENEVRIIVNYKDDKGQEYTETKLFEIALTNVPPSKVPLVFLNSAIIKLEHMDIKNLSMLLGVSLVVFFTLISLVIKKNKR